MNAICTQCGVQFLAASTEDAYDPERLCGECYRKKNTVYISFDDGSQPSLWVSPSGDSKAVPAFAEWAGERTAYHIAAQVMALGKRAEDAERRLKSALGGDKPGERINSKELARFWSMEAAEQKRRADALGKQISALQSELQSLRAEWDAIPTGALFDYWIGSEAKHPDAEDAAPDVEAWIKHLYDYVNGEGQAERWLK
jgi:hypothetical protein